MVPQQYEPAPLLQLLGSAIGVLRWCLLLVVLLPGRLLPLLLPQQRASAVAAAVEANRMLLLALVFIGGAVLSGLLLQTGAFEIYYERDLIWSAIERQQQGMAAMPTGGELLHALEAAGAPLLGSSRRF